MRTITIIIEHVHILVDYMTVIQIAAHALDLRPHINSAALREWYVYIARSLLVCCALAHA